MKERQKHGYFFSLSVIGTDMQSWASHFNLVWKTQDLLDLVIDGVLEMKMVPPPFLFREYKESLDSYS